MQNYFRVFRVFRCFRNQQEADGKAIRGKVILNNELHGLHELLLLQKQSAGGSDNSWDNYAHYGNLFPEENPMTDWVQNNELHGLHELLLCLKRITIINIISSTNMNRSLQAERRRVRPFVG